MSVQKSLSNIPDHTAIRVALWRALHTEYDAQPFVLNDTLGLQLANPEEGWRNRPDMHPEVTKPFRASIVARARYIDDFVLNENHSHQIKQYVILGAGLDTFAQRYSQHLDQIKVFEVDKKETQEWKQKRLQQLNLVIHKNLNFVPFDFEEKSDLWKSLELKGFNKNLSTVITSIGVSMYLTREAILRNLKEMSALAKGSVYVMSFLLPIEKVNEEDKPGFEMSIRGAQKSGTPFISFFIESEMIDLALKSGFSSAECISTLDMIPLYFADRQDGLKPSSGEVLLIARV